MYVYYIKCWFAVLEWRTDRLSSVMVEGGNGGVEDFKVGRTEGKEGQEARGRWQGRSTGAQWCCCVRNN